MQRATWHHLSAVLGIAALVVCAATAVHAETETDGKEKAAANVEAQTGNVAAAHAKSSTPEGNEQAAQARLEAEAKARTALEAAVARLRAIEELDEETAATLVSVETNAAASNEGSQRVATWIAERSGLTVEAIQAMRTETGAGWGEIFIATALSAETGLEASDLLALRLEGTEWGDIAAQHDMNLGLVVSGAAQAAAASEALNLRAGGATGAAASASAAGAAAAASAAGKSAAQAAQAAAQAGARAGGSVRVNR